MKELSDIKPALEVFKIGDIRRMNWDERAKIMNNIERMQDILAKNKHKFEKVSWQNTVDNFCDLYDKIAK